LWWISTYWLLSPGPVLLKHDVHTSKSDPLVEEVQLLHANPQYAHVRYADSRETIVSFRHLARLQCHTWNFTVKIHTHSSERPHQSKNTMVLSEQGPEGNQLPNVSSSGPTSLVPAIPVTPTNHLHSVI